MFHYRFKHYYCCCCINSSKFAFHLCFQLEAFLQLHLFNRKSHWDLYSKCRKRVKILFQPSLCLPDQPKPPAHLSSRAYLALGCKEKREAWSDCPPAHWVSVSLSVCQNVKSQCHASPSAVRSQHHASPSTMHHQVMSALEPARDRAWASLPAAASVAAAPEHPLGLR